MRSVEDGIPDQPYRKSGPVWSPWFYVAGFLNAIITWHWMAQFQGGMAVGSWPDATKRRLSPRLVRSGPGAEVWLVGFDALLTVFPKLLASAFAGYYLALFLILWCLILRGISLEVGGHIDDRMWQGFWDFVFVVSNTLLAVLFGAAAGNLARGVPLESDGTFSMAFFTDFTPHGYVGCWVVHPSRSSLASSWQRTARPISR